MKARGLSAGCLASVSVLIVATILPAEDGLEFYPRSYDFYVEKYKFQTIAERSQFPKLTGTERANLREYVENVFPVLMGRIPQDRDPQLLAWWLYREWIFKKPGTPWSYSNCQDTYDDPTWDCEQFSSGFWQVGYGVQVPDHIDRLRKVFRKIYPDKSPKEIGDTVLEKCARCKTLTFPALDLETLTNAKTRDNKTNGRRNRFWASVLMRDPLLSAYLEAESLYDPGGFPCYGRVRGEDVKVLPWCTKRRFDPKTKTYNPSFVDRRQEDSRMMLTIIDEWLKICGKVRPCPPRNLRVVP